MKVELMSHKLDQPTKVLHQESINQEVEPEVLIKLETLVMLVERINKLETLAMSQDINQELDHQVSINLELDQPCINQAPDQEQEQDLDKFIKLEPQEPQEQLHLINLEQLNLEAIAPIKLLEHPLTDQQPESLEPSESLEQPASLDRLDFLEQLESLEQPDLQETAHSVLPPIVTKRNE